MINYTCPICSKDFKSYKKNRVTCSLFCRIQSQQGKSPKNFDQWIEKGISTRFQKGREATNKLNLTKEELERLYVVNNLSLKKISELFICSPSTVLFYIKQYKIPSNPQGFQKGNKIQSKESHYNWKGGVSSLNNEIRSCGKSIEWRNLVFKRDSFTCQLCNIRGGKLHAHHIVTLSSILETYKIKTIEHAINCAFLWDISNGLTLCEKCHKLQHSKEGEKDD